MEDFFKSLNFEGGVSKIFAENAVRNFYTLDMIRSFTYQQFSKFCPLVGIVGGWEIALQNHLRLQEPVQGLAALPLVQAPQRGDLLELTLPGPKKTTPKPFTPRKLDDLMLLAPLGRSRSIAWKASKKERVMFLKVCDLYKQKDIVKCLRNEIKIYKRLKPLQGKYIPRLLYINGDLSGVWFGLGLQFIDAENLAKSEVTKETLSIIKRKTFLALRTIHFLDVLHGDIRPENILILQTESKYRVYFVDFEFSTICPYPSLEFEKEIGELKRMFRVLENTCEE